MILSVTLQQHLPFTVLKHGMPYHHMSRQTLVATAPTVYGIETRLLLRLLLR